MTPLQQAILLNLYRQQTKKNGRIDLPTIETLVHNFRNSPPINNPDNPQQTTSIIPSNPPLEVNNQPTAIMSENSNHNLPNNSIEPPINEVKNNDIPREMVKMKAEINENKSSENNPSPTYQVEYNPEKIILELYLQEVRQQLVKPSKKALKPIFFPNINKFLKDINY